MVIIYSGTNFSTGSERFKFSSKKDISFVNPYIFRAKFGKDSARNGFSLSRLGKKLADYYIFTRFMEVNSLISGKRVGLYSGNRFQSIIVRPQTVGASLSDFVRTFKYPVKKEKKKSTPKRGKKL